MYAIFPVALMCLALHPRPFDTNWASAEKILQPRAKLFLTFRVKFK